MREILFRGRHKYSDGKVGEWVYGSLSVMTDGHAFIIDHSKDCIYKVEPSTVGQYTGLEDCTDTMRIYEGDILKNTGYGATVIVEWQSDGFVARYKNGVEVALANVNEIYKVVGNIHEKVSE